MWILLAVTVFLGAMAVYDLGQRNHASLRNFPVIGHIKHSELITEIMLRYAETMPGWSKGSTALC